MSLNAPPPSRASARAGGRANRFWLMRPMNNSTQTVTVNKLEIEDWLLKVIEELKKNNVRNDKLTDAIETLKAIIKMPNPGGNTIKFIVEAIKSIGYNIVSSAIWQYLMTHPPI